jgi:hypothetical protein
VDENNCKSQNGLAYFMGDKSWRRKESFMTLIPGSFFSKLSRLDQDFDTKETERIFKNLLTNFL